MIFMGNHPENSDALLGFAPRHWGIPIAIIMYYLLPNSGHRTAPHPPTGDWWRKRRHYFTRKKEFYRSPLKIVLIRSHHTRKEGTYEHYFSFVFKKGAEKKIVRELTEFIPLGALAINNNTNNYQDNCNYGDNNTNRAVYFGNGETPS